MHTNLHTFSFTMKKDKQLPHARGINIQRKIVLPNLSFLENVYIYRLNTKKEVA